MSKDKACINCAHYSAFYRLSIIDFWIENEGVCRKHGKQFKNDYACDCWQKARPDYSVTVQMIDGAIENVMAIARLFDSED